MKTLKELSLDALSSVQSGYYSNASDEHSDFESISGNKRSLVKAIREVSSSSSSGLSTRKAIICEIKFASPSSGVISKREHHEVSRIAREMEEGGAIALSVLTEFKNFNGSLLNLRNAREGTSLPVIMKDIVVSLEQIRAAQRIGADAILLIEEIFSSGFAQDGLSLERAAMFAAELGLEVIIESHTEKGLKRAFELAPNAEIYGINNRDLATFKTSIETTARVLRNVNGLGARRQNPYLILSESGFENPADILLLLRDLKESSCPNTPDAFLIGTSIMRSGNIPKKVREFTNAR